MQKAEEVVHARVKPKSKRARNRVAEHGAVMQLVRRGFFKGHPATLVQAFDGWMGWFYRSEAEVVELGTVTSIYHIPFSQ